MLVIKITKNIKVQQSTNYGMKLFLKYKGKWILIKLTERQIELLHYILDIFYKNHGNKN